MLRFQPALILSLVLGTSIIALSSACGETPASVSAGTAQAELLVPHCRLLFVDEVHLSSERSGILAEVVTPGVSVVAGSKVAQLRDNLIRANLAIAEREASNDVEVRFASKVGELSQLKYERAVQANQSLAGTVSELEVRELRLAAEKSLLQLEQAQHQFAIAGLRRNELRENLNQLQITAPVNGFVRNVHKQPGEVVREGEVIAELVNTDRVRVEGYVDLKGVSKFQKGTPVFVEIDRLSPSEKRTVMPGRIGFVDVRIEPVTQKVRIWAEVQNLGGMIRDGQTATMRLDRTKHSTKAFR